MAATDDSDIEFMLCSVVKTKKEFSSKEKFQISNPNIVIADTGASVNVSESAEVMTNKRATTAGVSVVMGDGRAHLPINVGDVSVTQYNRNGTTGKKPLWKDVHVSEHFKYNLLSITKYMQEGWKLTGSDTWMTLTKGEVGLKFDILTAAVAAGKPKDAAAKSSVLKITIAIRDAHCKYGHMSEAECRQTTKALGCRVLCGV